MIAVVIHASPYYQSRGEEGLDFILAASAMSNHINIIFMDDGVWQLHKNQSPAAIQHKRYTAGFGALPSFGVNNIYIDSISLKSRHLNLEDLFLPATILTTTEIKPLLQQQQSIFHF